MFIVHVASDTATPYHAFMKNEDEKHIEHLTSSSLKGTWEYRQTNDFAGWEHQEGPAVSSPSVVIMTCLVSNHIISYPVDDLTRWKMDSVCKVPSLDL